MKYQAYFVTCLLTAMLAWFGSVLLGVPFWAVLGLVMPGLALAQMYAANRFNGRASLECEPVPLTGYEMRLDRLEVARLDFDQLGFQKTDEFYLRMACDVVTFVHQHTHEPLYLCDYHFGQMVGVDLITYFEDDITLTTTTMQSGGTVPRQPKSLLQVIQHRSPAEVFAYHQHAVDFIKGRGVRPVYVPYLTFKERFMQSIREFFRRTRNPLWSVKFIYWHFTRRGKIYMKPIQEQYLAGTIRIFKTAVS
ncbi:MAG: hypothetical protein JO360_11345 [Acidobacteria bacterium]|nr:hypothetical protein [Acidobacteriota bacterium]